MLSTDKSLRFLRLTAVSLCLLSDEEAAVFLRPPDLLLYEKEAF